MRDLLSCRNFQKNLYMKEHYLESRHIGLTESEEQQMLQTIGVNSLEELISQTMPADILLPEPIE